MTNRFEELHEALLDELRLERIRLLKPLLWRLENNQDVVADVGELREFVTAGSEAEVQPLIAFIDKACSLEGDNIKPVTDTSASSAERMTWVLEQLGLTELRSEILNRMPEPDPMVIVDEEFQDWYTPEVENRNANFWNDYVRVLNKKGWGAESIKTVNDQAREVLRRIEDPTAEHYVSSRGLVVGYVQSGKTANFTAVAAKAIDAGYRLVIILAGTLDNLRNQTQRRLDKELFGREAVLDGRDENKLSDRELKAETYFNDDIEWEYDWETEGQGFVVHGERMGTPGFPRIRRLTTSVNDYLGSGGGANPIIIDDPRTGAVHDPENLANMPCLVAVVKKNASVLDKLNNDLERARRSGKVIADLPTLIIDDESDQASINTKDNRSKKSGEELERTAVNEQITRLLSICPRSQYIGYTATPFANVFVDPADPQDLYPRHYVLMLNEPPEYKGAKWFHDKMDFADNPEDATIDNSNSKALIRELVEENQISEEFYDSLRRDELQEALDMFVLTGGIKKYREEQHEGLSFKHHTMLVHEAVHTTSHTNARKTLSEIWSQRMYGLGGAWDELQELYQSDVLPGMRLDRYNNGYSVPASFDDLKPFILEAVEEITNDVQRDDAPILQVDTEGKDSPNFEMGRVWKVLVGGAKLSRGYTVEGLTVSYFRRRAGGADTLMQTGRWFGFRKGYQDLVRLYCPPSLAEAFEAAMNDEESFRDNIKVYSDLNDSGQPKLTPMNLAPLVHQSLPDLKPTSRNKMFNAYLGATASAPRVVELNSIPDRNQRGKLKANFVNVAIPLLRSLTRTPSDFAYFRLEGARSGAPKPSAGFQKLHAGAINSLSFIELLEKMNWYEGAAYKENNVTPRIQYLRDLIGTGRHASPENSDFAEVAVLLPTPKSKATRTITVPGIDWPVPLVTRNRRDGRHDITGTDRKHAYALENIAAGNPSTVIKPEDWKEFGDQLGGKFSNLELPEPFDLDPMVAQARGAVLLTLFDDRDPEKTPGLRAPGEWTPPNFENGEVGVALAFNSPHRPINEGQEIYQWRVHVPAKEYAISIDAAEVEDS
ncbi:endonuclease [Corynebacterium hylobatis]|uniref:Endonuclease n=1 Tax=Corynebacterium hylobatis TaxID=1859290 RepID=A0A3R9ZFE7_9CORY|nr:Z1 domain-containing protein [Corynebacterium hylobatis]RSZ66015.1 endonuclease [Corynebacterium hylobatis]